MTEEKVTKLLLRYLLSENWKIISFDFPQGGTGSLLKSKLDSDSKNRKAIIPDIIATKNNHCIIMENKDRFYYDDVKKLEIMKYSDEYDDSLLKLLEIEPKSYNFGIGLPNILVNDDIINQCSNIDFILGVDNDNVYIYITKKEL